MGQFTDIVAALASRPQRAAEADYMDGGLLHCGKCHGAKQCVVTIAGRQIKAACMCDCEQAAYEAERQEERDKKEQAEIHALRSAGINDPKIRRYTFDMDDGKDVKMSRMMHRYVDHWEEMYAGNNGLLMCGPTGTGKTFYGGCIANALIDRKVSVCTTTFPAILNALMSVEDKTAYLDSLNKYKLLMIDDLGVERQSEYALEQVYTVIDNRYKTGRPLIVTTNLTKQMIENDPDLAHRRIYDRILEICIPLQFDGANRRREIAEQKKDEARRILMGL